MNLQYLSPKLVRAIVSAQRDGTIFTVLIRKRDGTLRRMTCRRGVRKYLKGGQSTIAGRPQLISVWDVAKHAYRCFDSGRTIRIRSRGAIIKAR